jgi:hypothetical protein
MLGNRWLVMLGGCVLVASAVRADELGYINCQSHPGSTDVLVKAANTPDVVTSLTCGARFKILIDGEIFVKIETNDGKVGYVYSSLVSRDNSATAAQQSAPSGLTDVPPSVSPVQNTDIRPELVQSRPPSGPPITQVSLRTIVAAGPFTLQDGTPVKLKLAQTISSADAHVGDEINFEVLEDITVDGVVVISKGALAIGSVTTAEPKKRMGRGGKLDINIDYARMADTNKAALRAVKEAKGGSHTAGMTVGIVATSLVVWPAAPFFLFMHGKDITIPEGTEITAFTNGDTRLEPTKFGVRIAETNTAANDAVSSQVSGEQAAPTRGVDDALSVVTFRASPDGAEISVDGKYVGDAPSTLKVQPGDHTIVIQKTGFNPWQRTLTVASGATLTVNATLEKPQQ